MSAAVGLTFVLSVRRPNWTECEGGWAKGPYLIEMLARDLWVLSRGSGLDAEILTTASSASELEAISSVHQQVSGVTRPLVLCMAYLMAVAGVIAGSVTGSTVAVLLASLVTVLVVVMFSEYMTARRVVQRRIPASIR